MFNRLKKRLKEKYISYADLANIIKMVGTTNIALVEGENLVWEEYTCGVFHLVETKKFDGTKHGEDIVIDGNVANRITPSNSMKGKDVHGILVTKPMTILIDEFLKNSELYTLRWKKIRQLADVQRTIYTMVGLP